MLDTIVGLLQETRGQRDALTNAARHLFSHMQVVSAGELRVNTLAGDDPIGMLADAFNFTIGRFRRFVLRAQTAGEQLEVISRQEIVRSDTFVQAWRAHRQGSSASDVFSSSPGRLHSSIGRDVTEGTNAAVTAQINRAHEHLLYVAREITRTHIRDVLNLVGQVTHAVTRLRQMTAPTSAHRPGNVSEDRQQAQELLALEKLLQQLGTKVQVMQTETMKGLSEVDMMINQFLPAEQSSNLGSLSSASEPNSSDIQIQELSRFAIGFAQDVTTLARQIGAIAQDMRTNVMAFKVEVAEDAARLNLLGATPNQFLAQELLRGNSQA